MSMDFKPSCIKQEFYPGTIEDQKEALKNSKQLAAYREYRLLHRDDPWNPGYHFYAPDGKINDPNGLCIWKGRYHLFYQAYPPKENIPNYDRLHWGHAVSDDMVHWKDLPIAIYPDVEYACWSGASLAEEDRVIAIYHGRWKGSMIATASDPLLLNWEKEEANPVIPILPNQDENGGRPYSMFDPCIWKDETGYYSLSGCLYGNLENRGKCHKNEMVEHLFHSQDLKHWTYMGELAPGGFPQIARGNDGGCPYFWPLGNRHMLLTFSHLSGAYATLGDLDPVTHHFTPDKTYKFNFGPLNCSSYQAPCATPDGKGGLYVILNTKDAYPFRAMERFGAMSVMYHMTLHEDGDIRIRPVEQLDCLHGQMTAFERIELSAFREKVLPVEGNMLDIRMKVDLRKARTVRIRVLRSPGCEEYTDVHLFQPAGLKIPRPAVSIDTINSSRQEGILGRIPETSEFDSEPDGKINLRILIDKCMLEVFANDRVVLMQMAYPTRDDSTGISVTALGSDAVIEDLRVWKMRGIYDDI